MISVAAYCRVSTDKEDQANSFESQQRYFREYIANLQNWQLYDIYADEGISGTSTQKRTQFNRMIRDAYEGKFSFIVTKEISRFSRNILDTITYTRDLKRIGVGVLFLTENLNTLHPESEMLLTFMGVLAQEESRRTSIRVKWGQTRQMERGIVFGHSLLGYDLQNGELSINESEADLVRLIFHKYVIEEKGTSVIARELQNAGYRTKTGNSKWNAGYIVKILRNEKYIGDLIQKKSITPDYLTHAKKTNHGEESLIVLHDHHAPIISRELWDKTQEILTGRNKHKGTGHSNRYLFSGKIRCGECGATFVGRQKRLQNGESYRRWSCGTVVSCGAEACSVGRLLRDDDARRIVQLALKRLQMARSAIVDHMSHIVMDAVAEGECSSINESERLRSKLKNIQKKKKLVLDSYFEGEITKEEMQTVKTGYDEEILDLERQIKELETRPTIREDQIRNTLTEILNGEAQSDAFFRAIVDHLTVYRDRRVELRFKGLSLIFIAQ